MMANAIPTLESITPEWLTGLLKASGVESEVARVTASPIGTGQVGATYRLALDYGRPAPHAPASLVAKLPSTDPLSRATGKSHLTYLRESGFYQHFAGRKPMAVPQHLFIAFDEESHDFALIMHDLPHHVSGNQLTIPTPREAELAMDAAASIHAAWWGDSALDTLDWLNGTKAVPPPLDGDMLFAAFWPGFCDRYGDRVTPAMKRVGEAFLGRMNEWAQRHAGPRCLTHNDFRPDNMLLAPDDAERPIIIVDWQTVGVGHGAGDIAYYLGTAMDPPTRRNVEAKLFARWFEALGRHDVADIDRAQQWDLFRAASVAGFSMGVTASQVVVQTDRGDAMFLAMAGRAAEMVLDHGAAAMPV